ncbi:hypothetical protein [Candidatus Venteria ishoeyi]|uniref:hypothetical protein n=1 Tax=Candidatus Venteria ishoeyi TaxID=1899563 RepID=UPI0015A994BF|nr:hypothetical protein [Candidatus Venteria ishoeyi]
MSDKLEFVLHKTNLNKKIVVVQKIRVTTNSFSNIFKEISTSLCKKPVALSDEI